MSDLTNALVGGIEATNGAGVIPANVGFLFDFSVSTFATKMKVAADARPSPSPSQLIRGPRRFVKTPAVAIWPDASAKFSEASANWLSTPVVKPGEAARGRNFFSSASSSEKSFMVDKIFLQS